MRNWLEINSELFDLMASIFITHFPTMHEFYSSITDKYELKIGVWATVAINFDYGEILTHRDANNLEDGYCWVLPFGIWEDGGGDLHFPEKKVTVMSKPGDITAFSSSQLWHEVTKHEGCHYSLTFFTHDKCTYNPSNEEEWGTYDLRYSENPLNRGTRKRKKRCGTTA